METKLISIRTRVLLFVTYAILSAGFFTAIAGNMEKNNSSSQLKEISSRFISNK